MKLPNAECAVIEREKIADYLLNAAHPDNGGKAAFFLALGFRQEEWQTLAAALRLGLSEAQVKELFFHLSFYTGISLARRGSLIARQVFDAH